MVAAQMGIEQGGASLWSADSNLCRHSAIEADGVNRVHKWTAGRLGRGSDQSRVQKTAVYKYYLKMKNIY